MSMPYYVYGNNLLERREKYTSVVNAYNGSEIVQKRYFSSIDTDVYFGDLLIDEMVAFDFILEEKKIPLFGYNNFTPKRLLTGQKSIQGSFAINFTRTFDMQMILESISESLYANEYEETQFYCADDNKAIFGKGFDITLSYGDHKGETSYNSCAQTLIGCYITSYRQAFDTSGEPILDMYTFIAKDLIYNSSTSVEEEAEDTGDNKTDNTTSTQQYSPEEYFVGNEGDPEENGKALTYYNEHKEDDTVPLCISINPSYNDVNGVSKLTTPVIIYNTDVNVQINSLKLIIKDKALKLSGYAYNLEKTSEGYYTYSMTGNQVEAGKSIKKYFSDPENDSLECEVQISCNAKDVKYNIAKTIQMYKVK